MATLLMTPAGEPAIDAATLDLRQAEQFTNLSYKTLERLAADGEPVGRIKVRGRVLFVRSLLEAWLLSQAERPEPPTGMIPTLMS